MPNYQLVKLLIDAAMVCSVLYLVFRVARSSTSSKLQPDYLQSIESSLKGVVAEAERASKDLGHDLSKRQKSLEEVLFDIETVEHRVNKVLEQAQEAKRGLERELRNAPTPAPQPQPQMPQQQYAPAYQHAAPQPQQPPQILSEEVEPPSFGAASLQPQPPASQPVNIYGEPIQSNTRESVSSPLREQIEKESEPEEVSGTGIEDVYAKAESLLRAGQDVGRVAVSTNLPEEDIEMLARIVSAEEGVSDENEQTVSSADDRLGVLSAIQRDRQVL